MTPPDELIGNTQPGGRTDIPTCFCQHTRGSHDERTPHSCQVQGCDCSQYRQRPPTSNPHS